MKLTSDRVFSFSEYPLLEKRIGPSSISLYEVVTNDKPKIDTRITNYLKNSITLTSYRGMDLDLIDKSKYILGTYSAFTDGNWLWFGYINHYYENYGLILPELFLENILNNKYLPKSFTTGQIQHLEDLYMNL